MIHRIFNTWIVESSTGILLTLQVFADAAYFLLNQLISLTCQIFADTAYFCWVITRYLCGLIQFCWHSMFCWINWFLVRQQIFAYSAIFCWVIIRHFDNSASFCCHSEFSTALIRWCKHNGQSARRCRCRQKPDAAQSPHTVNRRSASGQRSKYVVDRRSRYENRTSRFNKYCCDIGVIKCFI